MSGILSRLDRPVGRALFILATLFLLFFLAEIANLDFHTGRGLAMGQSPRAGWLYWFLTFMALVFGAQWLFSALGRIRSLRISRLWTVPLFLPWAFLLVTMAIGTAQQVVYVIILVLIVQSPLMILAGDPGPDRAK